MASNHPGLQVFLDPAVPSGCAFAVPLKSTYVGPDGHALDPRDWGFDAIYPEPPRQQTRFEQVEQWDRERRRAGLPPWIEARQSSVAGLSNVLKSVYGGDSMLHQLSASSALFWRSRQVTTGAKMLEDMLRYSGTTPTRRACAAIKNFRSGWRRQLALRLAPELQEDYSW